MTIPEYINCKTNTEHCDYLLHKDCKETCPYSSEIGIGGADIGLAERLNELGDQNPGVE